MPENEGDIPKLPPMTSVEKALVNAFTNVWHVLKAADTDLEAHKNAIAALLTEHPNLKEFLNARLVSARQAPALRQLMNQKYARVLDTFLQTIPDAETGLTVQEALENIHD